MSLSVIEQNKKFVVTENGKPINLPKTDGSAIVTEFDSKDDAEKYMKIVSSLKKMKKYA
jgi:exo-beta-1,3-glucanase (GH17 family)